jgi:Domain of unknown function (DUF1707)
MTDADDRRIAEAPSQRSVSAVDAPPCRTGRSDQSADPGGCSGAEGRPITAPEIGQAGMAYPGPASLPGSWVRASDADREHVIGVLREAFAEGRLTAEEHSARVGQAYAAWTYAELATVSTDLPPGPPAHRPAPELGQGCPARDRGAP